jgi:hypothetical protein
MPCLTYINCSALSVMSLLYQCCFYSSRKPSCDIEITIISSSSFKRHIINIAFKTLQPFGGFLTRSLYIMHQVFALINVLCLNVTLLRGTEELLCNYVSALLENVQRNLARLFRLYHHYRTQKEYPSYRSRISCV